MEIDCHYYGTYCMALAAGFEYNDARIIAWAAQTVDELNYEKLRELRKKDKDIRPVITVEKLLETINDATSFKDKQLFNMQKIIRATWPAFHFLPGNFRDEKGNAKLEINNDLTIDRIKYSDISVRAQNRTDTAMICLPSSSTCRLIIDNAKDQYDYYMHGKGDSWLRALCAVGICMHTLADTWSHQGFTGSCNAWVNTGITKDALSNGFNWMAGNMTSKEDLLKVKPAVVDNTKVVLFWATPLQVPVVPPVLYGAGALSPHSPAFTGHGFVGEDPDIPGKTWEYTPNYYTYDDKKACGGNRYNKIRFQNGFLQMYDVMRYIRGGTEGSFQFRTIDDLPNVTYDLNKLAQCYKDNELAEDIIINQLLYYISETLFTTKKTDIRVAAWKKADFKDFLAQDSGSRRRQLIVEGMTSQMVPYEHHNGGADDSHDEIISYKAFIDMAQLQRMVVMRYLEDNIPTIYRNYYMEGNLMEIVENEIK